MGLEHGRQRGDVRDYGSGVYVARNRVRSARNCHISDKALLSGGILTGQHDRIDVAPGNWSRMNENPQPANLGRGLDHDTDQTPDRQFLV
jgi:hypothetical protein